MNSVIAKSLNIKDEPKLHRKINNILYEQVTVSLSANIITGILFTFIMLGTIQQTTIFIWLAVLIVTAAIRIFIVHLYRIRSEEVIKTQFWYVVFIISVTITGSIWGSTIFLLPADVPVYETITVLFLCGLSSGSISTLAISRLAYLSFTIPALIPGIIALAFADSYLCHVLSITMFIYLCFIILNVLNTNKRLVKSLELEIENTDLVKELNEEKSRIEKFNDELEAEVAKRTSELEKLNTQFHQSEGQFKSIFINGPLGIAMLDKNGKVTQVNSQLANILDFPPEEIIGLRIEDVTHPDDLEANLNIFSKLLSGELNTTQIESRYIHKQRGYVWTRLNTSVVRDANGDILHIIALLEDISEQRQKEEQLIQAQKMEVMGQLTGGIAHDFNNLLTVIMGNLNFIKEEEHELKEEHQSLLNAALFAARDSAELTHGLLAVSRKQLLQPQNIEVNSVVEEFAKIVKRTLGTNIEIIVNKYKKPVYIFADPTQLNNALFNLIINARDAMPNGGHIKIDIRREIITDDITSESLKSGAYVVIKIIDNGHGISQKEIANVFDPFYSTKELGKGTGLGLSTVYGFTKQSDGKTEIESEVGKGTTISIFLPSTETSMNETSISDDISNAILKGTETILVTEDEPGIRQLAIKILSGLGYNILEAENADAAIEIMNTHNNIELLFSDIMMPGDKSGHDLAEWVLEYHPEIKVSLTSGFNKNPYTGDNKLVASIPILSKPYSKSQLSLHVRAVLDLETASSMAQ